MDSFDFLIAALAVWRITHLLVFEMGPANVFERLRSAAVNTWLGRLLDCFYCTSIWVALPLAAWISADWFHGLLGWLALSAAACLALQMMDKRRELVSPPVIDTPADLPANAPTEALSSPSR